MEGIELTMNFISIKDELRKIITRELEVAESIKGVLEKYKENFLLSQFQHFQSDVSRNEEGLKNNMSALSRTKMKCAAFGNTSNGKSSVLNALLEKGLLPTGLGHTTTCFISVEGCDDDEGYIMKDGQKLNLNEIGRLVNENRDEKQGIETIMKVFVPKSQTELLKAEVKILDSPGIDYSKDNDTWIKEYCQDVDVFLLVIDGCSAFNISEKLLFIQLSKKDIVLSILFVIYKWDEIEERENDAIREQHKKSIKECFVDELKLYSNEEIEERIFFVSATNLSLEDKDGNDFNKLKKKFKEDLERNAIERKLKGIIEHSVKTTNKCSEIIDNLKSLTKKGTNSNAEWRKIIKENWETNHQRNLDEVKEIQSNLTKECSEIIERLKSLRQMGTTEDAELFMKKLKENLEKKDIETKLEKVKEFSSNLSQTSIESFDYHNQYKQFKVRKTAELLQKNCIDLLEKIFKILNNELSSGNDPEISELVPYILRGIEDTGVLKLASSYLLNWFPGKESNDKPRTEIFDNLRNKILVNFLRQMDRLEEQLPEILIYWSCMDVSPDVVKGYLNTYVKFDETKKTFEQIITDKLNGFRDQMEGISAGQDTKEILSTKEEIQNAFQSVYPGKERKTNKIETSNQIRNILNKKVKIIMESCLQNVQSEITGSVVTCIEKYKKDQLEVFELLAVLLEKTAMNEEIKRNLQRMKELMDKVKEANEGQIKYRHSV